MGGDCTRTVTYNTTVMTVLVTLSSDTQALN